MAYIQLNNQLPGITGLLENRPDTGDPIRALTQILLRGPNTLTELERELIATLVSYKNQCRFCTSAHAATVIALGGSAELLNQVYNDLDNAAVSDKMKALLVIAGKVQQLGTAVTPENVAAAKAQGASDKEIHDTVLIAALFCLYNRYVDGLGTYRPEDPAYYEKLASRLITVGYTRPREGITVTGEASFH
ncbi:carboxymuconolactone decarboxylase family protein [Deminuibacter soli]|uniref:Carboxymuconolactone decarboxylase n=1 Tax=Deminuibacter soli TaxID=2291815 RepID=A0A3E1NH27_9BACT|nr:peroxidase-related enzyme [Deminuibacter soli]RFM27154.1 carboxymuconolactone decarboxylase [Deminuibacter soli]